MTSPASRTLFAVIFLLAAIDSPQPVQAIPPLSSGPLRENPTVTVPSPDTRRRGSAPATSRVPTPSRVPGGTSGASGAGFDWPGTIRDFSRGVLDPSTRRPVYPGPYQPTYPRPVVPARPVYPPNYVQPATPPTTPGYVQPATPPTVVLRPNVVTTLPVKVPKQPSPLEGRITEITTREAKCYTLEIAELVSTRLATVLDELKAGGIDILGMQKQADTTRHMLSNKAPWRDIEPVLKALMHAETGALPHKVLEELQQIAQFVMIRDTLLRIVGAPPRARSGPLPVSAIPVGLIWIVLDPSLPVGTGLFVSDTILVVGTGGQGELSIVKESAAAALGLPVAPGDPVPDVTEAEALSFQDAIVITHRPEATSSVNYVLNGRYPYSIEPGNKQRLPATQNWSIRFDRGNGRGAAQYAISQGVYEFRVVNGAWDLVRLQFDVTIDNREGAQDFQFVAEDKIVTVKAGETQVFSGAEPLMVKFDRGEGPEHAATKNLNKSGTYKVAVNTQNNLLDLYAMSDSASERPAIP